MSRCRQRPASTKPDERDRQRQAEHRDRLERGLGGTADDPPADAVDGRLGVELAAEREEPGRSLSERFQNGLSSDRYS